MCCVHAVKVRNVPRINPEQSTVQSVSGTNLVMTPSIGSKMRTVVISGLGVCCPLGTGVRHAWNKLIEGHSGIVNLPVAPEYEFLPSQVVGMVPKGSSTGLFNESEWATQAERKTMSLASVYALCAATEALKDSNWSPASERDCLTTGVSVGSGISDLAEIVHAGELLKENHYRKLSPYFVPRILTNMHAGHISMRFKLHGPNHSVSTACATGLHSIGDAAIMIARGVCDVMLAGGTEACVHPIAMAGFCRARALSTKFNSQPQKASRPFDATRDGFVLSEGAGIVVLEELEHAKARGAPIYAEILGYGLSGDAHHITSPSEDGGGAQRCMRAALKDARVPVTAVGYVSAHATSTPLGDAVENTAIKKVFDDHAPLLLVSSKKGSIGHLLGAAGAVEAVFTALSVKEGVVPPTLNLDRLQPEFNLNYVPREAVAWRGSGRRIALTNSFGFGGTNASICMGEI